MRKVKDRFISHKVERLISVTTDNQSFCSFAKTICRNFSPFIFLDIWNSSIFLGFDRFDKAEGFASQSAYNWTFFQSYFSTFHSFSQKCFYSCYDYRNNSRVLPNKNFSKPLSFEDASSIVLRVCAAESSPKMRCLLLSPLNQRTFSKVEDLSYPISLALSFFCDFESFQNLHLLPATFVTGTWKFAEWRLIRIWLAPLPDDLLAVISHF